jgi:hypothetical protein
MTNSPLERMLAALAAFLLANLSTYVARANAGTSGHQAPAPKKVEVKEYIPDNSATPYGMVNLDGATIEASGPNCQRITATVSVNFAFTEQNGDALSIDAVRYMDAMIDCLGENETLGGAVLAAALESIDKLVLPADGKGFVISTIRLEAETQT